MAKDQKPDFSCQTNDKPNSVVDAPCKKACKVTYRFVFRSKLSMPYAVAVNGKVLPAFKDRPKRTDSKIPLIVDAGQTVELYLNSDAHPAYRQHPVYKVTVCDDDVEVVITEVAGKLTCTDAPESGNPSKDEATGRTVQHMTAKLTGDIWMKVSHKYTPDEVDARMPTGTSEEVKSAVKKIYKGLSSATLTIDRPAQGEKPARTLTVKFADSSNPKENITSYSLLSDGLPRVHPGGYAALINAALQAEVQSVSVSSCWRPMLGSIAHRAGLGLDVSVVDGTTMNRQELRRSINASKTSPHGNGNDKDNVTEAEVKAFGGYEQALVDTKRAKAEKEAADQALAAAKKSGSAEATQRAVERQRNAVEALRNANMVDREKLDAWNAERALGEPNHVRQYRVALLRCACVRQLFDPWFMNANVKDATASEPNMQKTGNETLHAHHLHITVDDPKIL
ncbi:MAG: hypothetical protein Q7U28_05285 [Aquabacterium sp.]|nr:hypothetical protein [Aquabacterium sp.]